MAMKISNCHLLMMFLTFLALTTAQQGCTYQGRIYHHLDKFDHLNGCTQLQCQFGEAVLISEACGKEIDNSCHQVNFAFERDGEQYLCTKSEDSGSTVYRYVTQAIPKSPKGCIVGVQSYKHLELAVSKDTCRVRQCQHGQSPFVVSACKGHDQLCHPVESIYTFKGIMYRCNYSNNVFKFIPVQKPTKAPARVQTTLPTTVPTTESTTVPTTDSTTESTTVPTTTPPTARTCVAISNINTIFAIDASGSIGQGNFLKNFIFVRHIVQSVQRVSGLKFALLTYGTRTKLVSGLTDNKEQFSQALDKAIYQRSTTNTNHAIDRARGLALADDTGARTVIIVVTDGKSTNSTLTCEIAARAKDEKDILISIGVGDDFDESELQCIASGPGNVFRVHNYTDLDVLSSSIAECLCNVPPPPPGYK